MHTDLADAGENHFVSLLGFTACRQKSRSQHSSQAVTQRESEASLNSVTVYTMGAGMMLMFSVVTVSHFMFNQSLTDWSVEPVVTHMMHQTS